MWGARRQRILLWATCLVCLAIASTAYADDDERSPPPKDDTPLPGPGRGEQLPDRLLGGRGAQQDADSPEIEDESAIRPRVDPALAPGDPTLERVDALVAPPLVPEPQLPTWRRPPGARDAGLDPWRHYSPAALRDVGVRHPESLEHRRFHGSLRLRYRGRLADGEADDHDLYQTLRLEYGSAWRPGVYASLNGRLSQDVGDWGKDGSFNFFDSIADTRDDRVNARLYHAYVGYRPRCGLLADVRIGRQDVTSATWLPLDGVSIRTRESRQTAYTSLHAFAGVPSGHFDDSVSGDFMGGVGLERRFGLGRLFLDYAYVEDRRGFYGARNNHLWTALWRQRIGRDGIGRVRYSHLNGNPNELEFMYDGPVFRRRDLWVRARWKSLLTAQRALAFDLDPYIVITQSLEPYHEASLVVHKDLGPRLFAEAGATGRWLADGGDEGRYNREFQRFYGTIGTEDWPRCHWSLGLTGEVWTGDDTILSLGFEATYEPSRRLRLRLGTDFQRYRTDFYLDQERLDSRMVYVDARWRPTDRLDVRLRVRFEDDDYTAAWIVDTGTVFRF